MSTTLSPEAIQHIIETLKHALNITTISRFVSLAGFIVLVYDILLTLDEEMLLVWRARFSLVKCLYFLVRYGSVVFLLPPMYHMWPFRPQLSLTLCYAILEVGVVGNIICLAAANWLLIIRLGALYHGDKRITIPLYILLVVAYGLAVIFSIFTSKNVLPSVTFSHEVNLCVADRKFNGVVVPYAAPFLLELVTFILTVYKAVKSINYVTDAEGPSRLLFVVLRDGLGYYFLMLLLRLWNVYIFAALSMDYYYLGAYNMWALVATLMARLFLNVRDAANAQNWRPSTQTEQQQSTSAFVNSRARAISTGREQSRYGDHFVMELPTRSPIKGGPPSPLSMDKTAIHWN